MSIYEPSRKIIISSGIDAGVAGDVVAQIMEVNAVDNERIGSMLYYEPEPIEIFINSNGGSATDGFAIIGAMEMSDTPIVTYGLGQVASMALAIFASGDYRLAHRYARFMFHAVSYEIAGHITDHEAMQIEADTLQRMYNSVFLDNTKFTDEQIADIRLMKKDFFFSGKEAVKLGIADKLIKKEKREIEIIE